MKKMRIDFFARTFAFVMAVVFAVCFVACSNTANNTSNIETTQPTEDAVITTAPSTDSLSTTQDPTEDTTGMPEETTGTPETVEPGTDTEDTTTPVEDTTAPETKAPETKPPVTTAPETHAPADEKVYADPKEYPDDWGEEKDMLRTDGKTFFWKDSRVMHTAPKGFKDVRNWGIEFADEENDQFVFRIRISKGVYDYYSMVNGVFYKLNEGKVIFDWYDGTGPFYWIEEDGTAKSVNVRSKNYNEVYIEAEGVKDYIHSRNSFETFDGKLVEPNSENILAKVKEIS